MQYHYSTRSSVFHAGNDSYKCRPTDSPAQGLSANANTTAKPSAHRTHPKLQYYILVVPVFCTNLKATNFLKRDKIIIMCELKRNSECIAYLNVLSNIHFE
jgi:hypothetical protein